MVFLLVSAFKWWAEVWSGANHNRSTVISTISVTPLKLEFELIVFIISCSLAIDRGFDLADLVIKSIDRGSDLADLGLQLAIDLGSPLMISPQCCALRDTSQRHLENPFIKFDLQKKAGVGY